MSAGTRTRLQQVSYRWLVLLVCTSLLAQRALALWRPSYPYNQVHVEMDEGVDNYTNALVLQVDYLRWDGYFLNTYTITPGACFCLPGAHLTPVRFRGFQCGCTSPGPTSALPERVTKPGHSLCLLFG